MIYLTVDADVTITLMDADAAAIAVVDAVSEITVVSGSSACCYAVVDVAMASDAAATAVVAVTTAVSGLSCFLSAVADAAMASAAANLPSILSVCTSDLMRGYILLSPHIHSKTLSTGSVLWKNVRSFR